MADTGAPGFIPLYDDTTSFAPIQNPFNGISQALNAALKKSAFTTYADLATLNLPANAGTVNGQHATVNADSTAANNGDYQWNAASGAWVQSPRSGLIPILPASVGGVGATLGPNGAISLASATSASINGVFSSKYDNYLVMASIFFSASSLVQMLMRNGGADSTSGYSYMGVQGSGSSAGGGGTTGSAATFLTNQAGAVADFRSEFYAPSLAQSTRYTSTFYSVNGGTQAAGVIAGTHGVASAFDGLTIRPGTGGATMTGSIRIYAYSNN